MCWSQPHTAAILVTDGRTRTSRHVVPTRGGDTVPCRHVAPVTQPSLYDVFNSTRCCFSACRCIYMCVVHAAYSIIRNTYIDTLRPYSGVGFPPYSSEPHDRRLQPRQAAQSTNGLNTSVHIFKYIHIFTYKGRKAYFLWRSLAFMTSNH